MPIMENRQTSSVCKNEREEILQSNYEQVRYIRSCIVSCFLCKILIGVSRILPQTMVPSYEVSDVVTKKRSYSLRDTFFVQVFAYLRY